MNADREASLTLRDVEVTFGDFRALNLRGTRLCIPGEKVTAVLGGNGAGKTTLLNAINGFVRPEEGEIRWQHRSVTRLSPSQCYKLGMGRLWQDVRCFQMLTGYENVLAGFALRHDGSWAAVLGRGRLKSELALVEEDVEGLLRLVGLLDYANVPAKELSFGESKLLAIARALAGQPSLLLLDEPVSGLDRRKCSIVAEIIESLRERGATIIVVEHDPRVIRDLIDHAVYLERGRCIQSGSLDEIMASDEVRRRYLGFR